MRAACPPRSRRLRSLLDRILVCVGVSVGLWAAALAEAVT